MNYFDTGHVSLLSGTLLLSLFHNTPIAVNTFKTSNQVGIQDIVIFHSSSRIKET